MDNEYTQKQKQNLADYLDKLTSFQQGSSSSYGNQMDTLELERAGTSTVPTSKGPKMVVTEDEDEILSSQTSVASSVIRKDLETLLQKEETEEMKEVSVAIKGLDIDNTPNPPEKQKPKRLCGAAKRRYRHLIAKGMDEKTARVKCIEPMPQREGPSNQPERGDKRSRTDTTITPQADKKAKTSSGAIPKTTVRKPSFKEVVASVKVGIIPAAFPRKKLDSEEINQLRKEVLKLMFEQRNLPVAVRFAQGATAKSGWMIFHCSDVATADWLKNQELWTERELIAIDENQFPTGHTLVGYFRHSNEDPTEFILGIVDASNKGIDASSWKVLNRKDDGHLSIITVEVNEATFETLKKSDFLIYYAYGQRIRMKPKGKTNEMETDDQQPSTSSNPNPIPESGRQGEPQSSTSSGGAVSQGVSHREQSNVPKARIPNSTSTPKPERSHSSHRTHRNDDNRRRRDSHKGGPKPTNKNPSQPSKRHHRN